MITITDTPWGRPDDVTHVAEGIAFAHTPSHGGYVLSDERIAQIPSGIVGHTGSRRFWEEDCDWAVVALMWPEECAKEFQNTTVGDFIQIARRTLAEFHPEWLLKIDNHARP